MQLPQLQLTHRQPVQAQAAAFPSPGWGQLAQIPSAQAHSVHGQSMPSHCTQTQLWRAQAAQLQLLQAPVGQLQAVVWQCGQIT